MARRSRGPSQAAVTWALRLVVVVSVVVIGGLVIAGQEFGHLDPETAKESSVGANTSTALATETPTATPAPTRTPTPAPFDGLDRDALERAIHERVNAVRSDRGLASLSHSETLREAARMHSRDMDDRNYFAHTSPDGYTFEERYARAGYRCRVPVSDSEYLTGGENIYMLRYSGGPPSEETIARKTVQAWLDSPDHRENMLKPAWDDEGIGVAVGHHGGRGAVFVTQNFC